MVKRISGFSVGNRLKPVSCLLLLLAFCYVVRVTDRAMVENSTDTPTFAQRRYVISPFDQFLTYGNPDLTWNTSVLIKTTNRIFTETDNGKVFVLGVVAKNSTPTSAWDKFALYGQWYDHAIFNDSTLRCCFMYANKSIVETTWADYQMRDYESIMLKAKLLLWHVTCNRPTADNPEFVTVTRFLTCKSEHVNYVRPYYAMKKPEGYITITTKLAYNKMDADSVVSFLETVRYLGIDKVIVYVYKTLDPEIQSIMRYYSYVGILDYYSIELADETHTPRKFPPLYNQYMSDEWLVKRDALERSIGSTYFGIFDMDEFVIPSRNRTLKMLLRDLRLMYPNASHFFFQTVHYLTDHTVEKCSELCPVFERHVMTAPLRSNQVHEKMFLITSRVDTKTINNHHVTPLPGYVRETCPNTEAYLRHYGSCSRKFTSPWLHGSICEHNDTWIEDTSMVPWAEERVNSIIGKTLNFLTNKISK